MPIQAKPRPPFDDLLDAARVSSFMGEHEVGRWKTVHFTVTPIEHQISRIQGRLSDPWLADMRDERTVPPGDYICLQRRMTEAERLDRANFEDVEAADGDPRYLPIMSDTPSEIAEHSHAFRHAEGNVLITGLGLGVLVSALLAKPCAACRGSGAMAVDSYGKHGTCVRCAGSGKAVDTITVVEIDRDVIAITGPYYEDEPRVAIINDDALAFSERTRFGLGIGVVSADFRFDYAWHDIWSHISDRNIERDDMAEHGISYKTLFDAYAPFVKKQGAWAYPEAMRMREVRDREHEAGVAFAEAMLNGSRDERVELLLDWRMREYAIGLPPDQPIPDEVRQFFEEHGAREWAEKTADNLDLDRIREAAAIPRWSDPMQRPNEDPEANVADSLADLRPCTSDGLPL